MSFGLLSPSPPSLTPTTALHLHLELNISIFTSQESGPGETLGRWGPRSYNTRNIITAISGFKNQFAKQEFSNSPWIRLSSASEAQGPKEERLQEALENKALQLLQSQGRQ